MKSEAEYLFSNTSDKMTQNNDSFFNACVGLAMEELAIVTGRRDASLDIKHITGMLELCKAIGISCKNLYICDRTVTSREIIYTLGYLNKDVKFNILTELDGDVVHTGILKDFDV
jgi:hypothetical protein